MHDKTQSDAERFDREARAEMTQHGDRALTPPAPPAPPPKRVIGEYAPGIKPRSAIPQENSASEEKHVDAELEAEISRLTEALRSAGRMVTISGLTDEEGVAQSLGVSVRTIKEWRLSDQRLLAGEELVGELGPAWVRLKSGALRYGIRELVMWLATRRRASR